MSQQTIPLRNLEEERTLFGTLDRNLQLLRRRFNVDAVSRGGILTLQGDPESLDAAAEAVQRALDLIRSSREVDAEALDRVFRGQREEGDRQELNRLAEPRSRNQTRYMEAIQQNTLTFAIGPAGTGKSYLAVAMAVAYLKAGRFRRVILCRPAVEAGESLGFLPGDLAAKIHPYLRPLYDALYHFLPRQEVKRLVEEEVIEILPLAYMRGRTLERAVIILDEAQNCTMGQMKMALTRLGAHSKMVVTGDITQVDLPERISSGLIHARHILTGISGVAFIHLAKQDIVRHPVVAEIVRAYAREDQGGRLVGGASKEGDNRRGDDRRRRPERPRGAT